MKQQLKNFINQDIDWMNADGYYTVANRLHIILAAIEQEEKDKKDLQNAVGVLLKHIDELYTPEDGQLSMHTYGQTPDWFVEASHLACYGTTGYKDGISRLEDIDGKAFGHLLQKDQKITITFGY